MGPAHKHWGKPEQIKQEWKDSIAASTPEPKCIMILNVTTMIWK